VSVNKKQSNSDFYILNVLHKFLIFNLSWAIVEFAEDARRRERSCSVLPQAPCNTADSVKSASPKGFKVWHSST